MGTKRRGRDARDTIKARAGRPRHDMDEKERLVRDNEALHLIIQKKEGELAAQKLAIDGLILRIGDLQNLNMTLMMKIEELKEGKNE